MEVVSTSKFLVISPRKIRPIAKQISKMSPKEALAVLSIVNKAASLPLAKTIKSAIANAQLRGFSGDNLIFRSIQIGEGPRLKRARPVAKGAWHPYKRRMSHIRVVLEAKTTNEKLKVQSAKLFPQKRDPSKDRKEKTKK